jgi:cytohesin
MRMKSLAAILLSVASVAVVAGQQKQGAQDVFLSVAGDVNRPADDGTTAIHRAVLANDLKAVQALIKAGADVKAANQYHVTPMWLAANNGNAAILGALMAAGADPNTVMWEGETALMTGDRAGVPEAVRTLIAHGANVNAKESW